MFNMFNNFAVAGWLLLGLGAITFVLAVLLALLFIRKARRKRKIEASELLEGAGFAYDSEQDIFYSTLDAWQRKFGYCELYDKAAVPLSIVFHCEPIRFDYEGKHWLIEFWKGQYGICAGGEIGVYAADQKSTEERGEPNDIFYDKTDELFPMAMTLLDKGKVRFTREQEHWWLTGFALGDYCEPSDLVVQAQITLKTEEMCNAFVEALKRSGYQEGEYQAFGNTVCVLFQKPYSPQPMEANPILAELLQKKNRMLCQSFQEITGGIGSALDKLMYVQRKEPRLFPMLFNERKGKKLYATFFKGAKS